MLSSNQIAASFRHQCFWKEIVIALDFLHRETYWGKMTSTTSIVDLWVGCGQDCLENESESFQRYQEYFFSRFLTHNFRHWLFLIYIVFSYGTMEKERLTHSDSGVETLTIDQEASRPKQLQKQKRRQGS